MIKTSRISLDGITSVCLPDQGGHIGPDDSGPVNYCYTAGWGRTELGSGSTTLQSARVNIFSADYCERRRFLEGSKVMYKHLTR